MTRVLGSIYPFGYGLSYTTFAYGNLRITPEPSHTQGSFRVTCDVTNTATAAATRSCSSTSTTVFRAW